MGVNRTATSTLRVISASRRLDMVAGYPEELVSFLEDRCPPETTHSIVLWTKDPRNLLEHRRLRSVLDRYQQIFLHLTITGLGATLLESRVPEPEVIVARLPELIDYVGGPDRLRVRFDPIIHIRLQNGREVCNLRYFEKLAPEMRRLGLRDVTTSWMTVYPKVRRRLATIGAVAVEPPLELWQRESHWLLAVAGRYGIRVHGCCVRGWPRSRCIDGYLLTELHPQGLAASTRRATGQRELCGCTESLDIGWYKKCPLGCLYCYANPVEHSSLGGARPFSPEVLTEFSAKADVVGQNYADSLPKK